MAASAGTLSKGEYAKAKGVSAGRVSQWIAEGKLDATALDGEGRFARVKVAVADQQLRERLDIGQMLGNGITTQLSDDDDAEDQQLPLRSSPAAGLPNRNPLDESIRRAKLEQLQRVNRQAEREELADRGVYIPTADAQAAMVGVAAAMLTTFEGGLADFASALAAKFELPQRDVLHLLKSEFKAVRTKAAEAARRKAASLEAIVLHDPEESAEAA